MKNVSLVIDGTADEVAGAVERLFGRQAGFKAPTETVQNAASVQYGTTRISVEVNNGDSVAGLFAKSSGRLGLEAGRALTFQSGGSVVDGAEAAQVGAEYLAVPNHDPKG